MSYEEELLTYLKENILVENDFSLNEEEQYDKVEEEYPFLVNLTPYTVILNGKKILPSPNSAHCTILTEVIGNLNEIEIRKKKFGDIINLPDPIEGKYFIVSPTVAQALGGSRDDVFVADGIAKDESDDIISCTGLAKI